MSEWSGRRDGGATPAERVSPWRADREMEAAHG